MKACFYICLIYCQFIPPITVLRSVSNSLPCVPKPQDATTKRNGQWTFRFTASTKFLDDIRCKLRIYIAHLSISQGLVQGTGTKKKRLHIRVPLLGSNLVVVPKAAVTLQRSHTTIHQAKEKGSLNSFRSSGVDFFISVLSLVLYVCRYVCMRVQWILIPSFHY